MKQVNMLLNAIVLLIGLYMVVTNWGGITPPMLSGIAFVAIGIKNCELLKK